MSTQGKMARSKKRRSPKNTVPNQLTELENAIAEVRSSRKISPRTARLVSSGLPRMAQKVAEEATEVVIEAVRGRRAAVIGESVDLIYNLAVLWSELGIAASEVWAEMDRRQALLGMAEKLPKDGEETAVEQNHSLRR
jgi:phosphoribosyl-ATP pyrophosphohydrolase